MNAEDGLALVEELPAEMWDLCKNISVSVMVDSGALGHSFNSPLIIQLSYRLDNDQK